MNRVLRPDRKETRSLESREMPQVRLDVEQVKNVKNLARGVYSPLAGFMGREDCERVLEDERLASDVPWTIPVTLDADRGSCGFEDGDTVALTDQSGDCVATMEVDDMYPWDRRSFAARVFGTTDASHPGVAKLASRKDSLVGGRVQLLDNAKETFPQLNLDPWETRILFTKRGWRTVAGYQTRNPPHRAHEFLQKIVLSLVDGIFVNPVIGRKKRGDFTDAAIVDAYQALISNYYPRERAVMSILPYEMQYAGPKEAVLHAIIRKNFGCTHFVVGRDHAGVGKFYHPEAAIDKFAEFPDLDIEPIAIRGDHFWCLVCHGLESERTCPHGEAEHVPFSGTLVRKLLAEGKDAPPEVMRPEVLAAIRKHDKPFVEG